MAGMVACKYPTVSVNPQVQADYEECRRNGHGHKMADMLAHAEGPGVMTDAVFMHGRCRGNQFEKTPKIGNHYAKEARRAGQDITGKVYLSGLARYPGDHEAWVDGRGDVQKLCEQRGWTCDGAVKVKSEPEQPREIDVAPDIVVDHVEREVEAQGGNLKPQEVSDIREKVVDRLSPSWSKRKRGRKHDS